MPCTRGASPTMSSTRMRGLSEDMGSWKIICTAKLAALRCAAVMADSGVPSKCISPALASWTPATTLPSVDLPQPDSPTSPTTSPGITCKLTWSTACTTSSRWRAPSRLAKRAAVSSGLTKRLETSCSSMMGVVMGSPMGQGVMAAHQAAVGHGGDVGCGLAASVAGIAAARGKCATGGQMPQ